MIDLNTLRKGDTVHFRCGGEAVVDSILESGVFIGIKWNADTVSFYSKDGMKACVDEFNREWHVSINHCPFDIIRITPAEFDWDTVKHGMAFRYEKTGGGIQPGIYYYIAPKPDGDGEEHFFSSMRCPGSACAWSSHHYDLLIRAPEHDIPEVK